MAIFSSFILDGLFRHAQQTPDKTALLCGERRWSFRQLAENAGAMAAALRQSGVAGQAVLINLPKSLEAVAAIYAIWLSGNHYIPIDYSQPAARLERIIAAAEPALIIDEDWLRSFAACADGSPEWPAQPVMLSDPIAAILYTSGSTGTPKGVQISHGMLTFFIRWAVGDTQLTAQDTLANHASFAFDLSTFDLFAGVSVGAAVWIIREDEQKDCRAIAQGLQTHGVSVWYSVPSILAMLEKSGQLTVDGCAALRQVIFAGEPYPVAALRRLLPHLPAQCRISNWYGPTETNVCTAYPIARASLERLEHVPIGYPLAGVDAQLIDEQGRRYPLDQALGMRGELLIGGPCVTPGYSNVAVSRQSDWHPRQFHATGDWVEMTADGLVFRGRLDEMVKINGYRVELGEIESAVHHHPAVNQAALYAELGDLKQKLVAVISLGPDASPPTLLELKQFLHARLPAYMIPHRLIIADSLPVNANGKVDRRRLAEVHTQ
ncbi:D-alanine--poly(phosphoribitol) ligase [Serratia rubidaea]|uniref:D-alanine--poly(phosphoribitol) ligase n=1 Tax=Serratia rubidaea TaxID=61652 RepID=UPI002DB8675A|nr:D-alanine--poly(phosphoribitol) ligase [Serratia rubidaea]MEB7587592.1 D-alanine--poly(phosphoribitol) ligase [Serratia rubidaea]